MTRQRALIIVCLLPILAASMSRVAATFALYTTPTDGWLAAFGIDGMISVLMWRIMDGERSPAHRWALAGVVLASAVSAQANLAAAAATPAGKAALAAGGWPLSILATVSVTLPVLVGILAAVAHGDAKTPAPDASVARSAAIRPEPAVYAGPGAQRRAARAAGRNGDGVALPAPVAVLLADHPAATLDEIGAAIGRHRATAGRMMDRLGYARGAGGAWAAGD